MPRDIAQKREQSRNNFRAAQERARKQTNADCVREMLLSARKMASIGERLKESGATMEMMARAFAVIKKESTTFFLCEDRLKMRGVELYADSGQQLLEGVVGACAGSDDQQSEGVED